MRSIGNWFVADCECIKTGTRYVLVTQASTYDQAAAKLFSRVTRVTGKKQKLICTNVDYLTEDTAKDYGVAFRLMEQFKTEKEGGQPLL